MALGLVAAGAAVATLISVGTAGAGSPSSVQTVREQNLDAQGNIKVHEQGTPQVSLTGDPRVGLDPTLGNTVKIAADQNTVKIDAAGSGPIQTQSTDNPAFSPVEAEAQILFGSNAFASGTVYTVPSGHELVIEQMSFGISLGAGTAGVSAAIQTTVDGQATDFGVPMPKPWDASAADAFSDGDLVTRIYADPATHVTCVVLRPASDTSTSHGASCSISGYLVPVK
jgi:hypothetical protein